MKALIIGATGATGKDLINALLQNPAYKEVTAFVHKSSGVTHPKLTEIITDFDHLENVSPSIQGDVLFSCMGTTLKAAGSKAKQWHIDYEIPLKFASIARDNEVRSMVLLSAYGASSASSVFYSQMKGKLEEAMETLRFNQYIIFKPGLLVRKDTDRAGERIFASALRILNTLHLAKKFKPLPTSILAGKLAKAPLILDQGKHVIALEKIFDF